MLPTSIDAGPTRFRRLVEGLLASDGAQSLGVRSA